MSEPLDRLAALIIGEQRDGIVRGDAARRQVTDLIQPRLAVLMASGMTPTQAMSALLAAGPPSWLSPPP